jgi:hypothetical protein
MKGNMELFNHKIVFLVFVVQHTARSEYYITHIMLYLRKNFIHIWR